MDLFTKEEGIITQNGTEILNTNSFFRDLIRVMKNTTFRKFYNQYFNDWSDVQIMVFYMKLYTVIEDKFRQEYGRQINDEMLVYVMHQIMSNSETRQLALDLFKNYKENVDMAPLYPLIKLPNSNIV